MATAVSDDALARGHEALASGNWEDDTYRVGYAVCAGPVGPCTSGANPVLQSYGAVAGPGVPQHRR